MFLDYDEHYAECPKCGHGSCGTSSDSRANLPGFDFDYKKQVFICETCDVECMAYYETYDDPECEEKAEHMTDVTAELLPEQHELNKRLEHEKAMHDPVYFAKHFAAVELHPWQERLIQQLGEKT